MGLFGFCNVILTLNVFAFRIEGTVTVSCADSEENKRYTSITTASKQRQRSLQIGSPTSDHIYSTRTISKHRLHAGVAKIGATRDVRRRRTPAASTEWSFSPSTHFGQSVYPLSDNSVTDKLPRGSACQGNRIAWSKHRAHPSTRPDWAR